MSKLGATLIKWILETLSSFVWQGASPFLQGGLDSSVLPFCKKGEQRSPNGINQRFSNIGVVIPAYNEELMVGRVVAEVKALGFTVIVVDDNSGDATAECAAAAGAHVISMPIRAGAWGAAQAGMRHALRLGWEKIITMDADGQHLARSLPLLVEASAGVDVIIGACPERASRLRLAAWKIFRKLSGLRVKDLTSGLRIYNRRAARLALRSRGVLADYQDVPILLLLQACNLDIREVAVPMCRRCDGKSRIFYSWGRVAVYMLCTILLASAHCGMSHAGSKR